MISNMNIENQLLPMCNTALESAFYYFVYLCFFTMNLQNNIIYINKLIIITVSKSYLFINIYIY